MIPVSDLLFTVLVFAAVVVLFTAYRDLVIAVTLFLVIWQFVAVFGATLQLATMLLVLATLLRAAALLVTDLDVETSFLIETLDALLSRRQQQPDEPPGQQRRHTANKPDRDTGETDDPHR